MIRVILILIAFLLFILAAVANAAGTDGASYPARVVRVLDGDTFAAVVRIWPNVQADVSVRVRGIDTPESGPRARCDSERLRADSAKVRVIGLLPAGSEIRLTNVGQDKYAGRVVARVVLPDGRSLADVLIEEGLARPYDGGTKQGWCP